MNNKTYTITDTRKIEKLTLGGNTQTWFVVGITTDHGSTGSIEVKSEDWKSDKLKGILQALADDLDLAYTLTES
jgi:hypothetical protein